MKLKEAKRKRQLKEGRYPPDEILSDMVIELDDLINGSKGKKVFDSTQLRSLQKCMDTMEDISMEIETTFDD